MLSRFLADYGMLFVLVAVSAVFSVVTYAEQSPTGAAGGAALAAEVVRETAPGARVAVVVRDTPDDRAFADALTAALAEAGRTVVATARGEPAEARRALNGLAPDAIAATRETAAWPVLEGRGVPVFAPQPYAWPNFLKAANLLNVADQSAVIAIMAVGMTLVIITGGIDLSVGSVAALAAVLATLLMRDLAGARDTTALGMALCGLAAVAVCGLVGLANGALVSVGRLPPFIVTLGMLLIARGLARRLSEGESIFQVPAEFAWLARGALLPGVPNAVLLMAVLYLLAHGIMSRTTFGRYVYAVGGNAEAARLAGVSVRGVLLLVYALSGALAGLGGVLLASQFQSGSGTYAPDYELHVIAAVVVGGTSISGGEGKILGTLIGAFLIAVINNGMNLCNIKPENQLIVLGGIIIGAVLLDRVKHLGQRRR